jgi:hypothetical protein
MNEEIEALKAQCGALALTLTAVIATLPQLQAAQAAVHLKIELETEQAEGLADPDMSDETWQARGAMLDAFLGLLAERARVG